MASEAGGSGSLMSAERRSFAPSTMTGLRKAAILMIAVGDDLAKVFFRSLSQIDVQQIALDGIVLLIGHDDGSLLDALDIHIEDGVVAGFAAENPGHVPGVDADGDRIFEGSVNHGRDPTRHSGAPRFIFTARGARLRGNYRFKSQLPAPLRKSVSKPLGKR